MLKTLILHNFRSFASASIDFTPFTFLVGRNGSGKSNIADALAFLSEAVEWPLQTVFNRRGGPISVVHRNAGPAVRALTDPQMFGLGVEFADAHAWTEGFGQSENVDVKYSFLLSVNRVGFEVRREQCIVKRKNGEKIWFDRQRSKFQSSMEILNNFAVASPETLAMPLLASLPPLMGARFAMNSMATYSIEPGKLREFQDPDAGKQLASDGSNAASVLREMGNDSPKTRRLFEILSTVIPDLERVRPQTIGRKQHLRFIQQWSPNDRVIFDAFNMSDGTLRAFGILLALFQNGRPGLLVIEEPETSLHPAAAAAIVETLREESKRCQIVMTTHSPDILDLAGPTENNFRIVSWSKGRSSIGHVEGAAKASLQQHLATPGELFRMLILDAPPLFEELEEDRQQELFEELE